MGDIHYNPNLPPGDPPDDELIIQKLGGLMLGDPEAFEEQPTIESSNLDDFMAGLDDLFDDYASEPVEPRRKRRRDE